MTAKKAIEFLRMHFEYLKERWKPYPDYNVLEAIRFAISAIEKQIPKKPTPIDYEKYIDVIDNARFLRGAYWCPNCKHVVKTGSFCSDCGQKLDWRDENERS